MTRRQLELDVAIGCALLDELREIIAAVGHSHCAIIIDVLLDGATARLIRERPDVVRRLLGESRNAQH